MKDFSEEYFKQAFDFIIRHEGILSEDKWGGKTIYGISQNNYPDWFQRVYQLWVDGDHEKALEEAANFYRSVFWERNGCSDLFYPLNILFFDTAVNMGLIGAGKILQRALNLMGFGLKEDGLVGPKTKRAVLEAKSSYGRDLLYVFLMTRMDKYMDMKSHAKFWRGYWNRIFDLAKEFIIF